MKEFTIEENKLIETTTETVVCRVEHNLDDLIKIRESIDISESEYLTKIQAEKDKYDVLIAEAKKKGLKESEKVEIAEEAMVE